MWGGARPPTTRADPSIVNFRRGEETERQGESARRERERHRNRACRKILECAVTCCDGRDMVGQALLIPSNIIIEGAWVRGLPAALLVFTTLFAAIFWGLPQKRGACQGLARGLPGLAGGLPGAYKGLCGGSLGLPELLPCTPAADQQACRQAACVFLANVCP